MRKFFEIGKVRKMKSSHDGRTMSVKPKSISHMPYSDDLIELNKRLQQEGFNSIIDKEVMLIDEIYTDNKGVTHINVNKGAFIKIYNNDYSISIYDKGNGFELYRLEVFNQGKGLGSKFLQILNKISCEMDYPVFLKPGNPGHQIKYVGQQDQRLKFYLKNGFNIIHDHAFAPTFSNEKIVNQFYA